MNFICELPKELKSEVLRYYILQHDLKLLDDIREFEISYQIIVELTFIYFELLNYPDNIIEYHVYGNLSNYIIESLYDKTNVQRYPFYEFNNEFIELMKTRSFVFKIHDNKIKNFILRPPNGHISKKSKNLWYLLNIEERENMIKIIQQKIQKRFPDIELN